LWEIYFYLLVKHTPARTEREQVQTKQD